MNLSKLIIAMITAGVFLADQVRAEVTIEVPPPNGTIQGISTISGFSTGSNQMRILIDGGFVTNAHASTERDDVNPDIPTGFSATFNYGLLADGEHTITISDALTGESSNTTFNTVSLSNSFLKSSDVSPSKYHGVNVLVKGQEVRFDIEFSQATQRFEIVAVDKPDTEPNPTGLTKFQSESLDRVNYWRAKGTFCGEGNFRPPVSPVVWLDGLGRAARKQAEYLTEIDNLQHEGRNGISPGGRITNEGVVWNTWSENAHQIDAPAKRVVDEYIADVGVPSFGHCLNIMNGVMTHFGTAIDGKYSIQDFARLAR